MRFVLLEAFLAEVPIFFLYNNRPQTKIWHCFYIIFVQYLKFNVKKNLITIIGSCRKYRTIIHDILF